MSNTNTGGPAFPGVKWVQQGENINPDGMTLRDYFAAKAMQGVLVGIECGPDDVANLAESAYILADAMLKAREA
jgi:hypothetical protein